MDDGMQLNLSSEPFEFKEKKSKASKQARLKNKRDERREKRLADAATVHDKAAARDKKRESSGGEETATAKDTTSNDKIDSEHKKGKKRKQKKDSTADNEPKSKLTKFSSLFRNNPKIPEVAIQTSKSASEKVFSEQNFSMEELHPFMVSNLSSKLSVTEMTRVQQAAIPHVLNGADTLIKSQTGSGKTLAYAVPIIQKLQAVMPKVTRADGVYAVVIVPTRELALQVLETFTKLVQPFTWIVPGCIMGGEKRKSEKARLRKGVNVLVATPGRLCDHMEKTSSLDLTRLKWLVIDEADRLLDMGFEKEVKKFIEELDNKTTNRQTVLVSATLSAGVERLAGMSLHDPAKVDMSDKDSLTKVQKPVAAFKAQKDKQEIFATPDSLRHHFVTVPHKLRLVTLAAFLLMHCKKAGKGVGKVLIFLSTQEAVEFHHVLLTACLVKKYPQLALHKLHGDMLQRDRTKVFMEFAKAKAGILLCTDVAARGLDLPHVQWIVQYTPPGAATDYIHRVGRTARIGSHGQALLFLAPAETAYVNVLRGINISLQEKPMNSILKTLILEAETIRRAGKPMPNTIEECATALQMGFEEYVGANMETRTLARKAYQSFVRSYATYPSSLKSIFHVKTLHLGHLAKSFALQDSPGHIGDIIHNHASAYSNKKHKKGKGAVKKPRLDLISEFASGM